MFVILNMFKYLRLFHEKIQSKLSAIATRIMYQTLQLSVKALKERQSRGLILFEKVFY